MTTSGGGNWPFERVAEPPAGGRTVSGQGAQRPIAPSGFSGTAPEHAAGTGAGRGGGSGRGGGRGGRPGRRRPPIWLLVLVGLVVVAAVVIAVLKLSDNGGTAAETPPAQTVTLPVPTPTVAPIERQPGTAFQQALPATVLAYALKEEVADPELVLAGAVEAWKLTYTDGAQDVVLHAGQWRDAAAADAAFQQVVAANPLPAADAAATPVPDQPQPEQGSVQVGGQQVGSFLFLPKADGTGTLWWTNTTAMLRIEGPATALRDVYAAFTL